MIEKLLLSYNKSTLFPPFPLEANSTPKKKSYPFAITISLTLKNSLRSPSKRASKQKCKKRTRQK